VGKSEYRTSDGISCYGSGKQLRQQKRKPRLLARAFWQTCSSLEEVPEELVVDLVVKLDFLRFDKSS
jgi:hypothetical protein